jgi:hypothetical protein
LRASSDDDLGPTHMTPFGPTSGTVIVAAHLNEVSHHGAQICQLRDLYAATAARTAS